MIFGGMTMQRCYLWLFSLGFLGLVHAQENLSPKVWRSGWLGKIQNGDQVIAAAKELGFNALIMRGTFEEIEAFSKKARVNGIDTYWCLALNMRRKEEMSDLLQVMPKHDSELLAKHRADKTWRHSYQHGGEPTSGPDVFKAPLLCFHHEEVRLWLQDAIKETLRQCPTLTGIAFDGFAYQNYRNCVCEESLRQLAEFHKKNPGFSEEAAEKAFALTSLTGCINGLADFARSLRPGLKTTIHVWPVHLPEPLYGNRLDLDFCCQTVAWFFPPYWSNEKIAAYSRTVVNDDQKHFQRSKGIPFIGIYLGKKHLVDKPLEQFRNELRIIFDNTPDLSLGVHSFIDIVEHREYYDVLREELQRHR